MKRKTEIFLSEKLSISDQSNCFFIAEAGVNHNGNLENAIKLIDAAVEAGADAVKFQTFSASQIATQYAPKSTYHLETTGNDEHQSWLELLKSQELSVEDHEVLFKYSAKKNIIFLSTPYDLESVDLLENLGVSLLKVASTDLNNHRLLKYMAKTSIPIILSTAMSTIEEVLQSQNILINAGCSELAILQCTGSYPTIDNDLNIGAMLHIREKTNCLIGFSDHSTGVNAVSIAAAAGAKIVEKHFTLDRSMPGPDHRASLEPTELKECINLMRRTETMMGLGEKIVLDCESENRRKLRKFTVAARDFEKGHVLRDEDLLLKRTGGEGVSAAKVGSIVGKTLIKDVIADQVVDLDVIGES